MWLVMLMGRQEEARSLGLLGFSWGQIKLVLSRSGIIPESMELLRMVVIMSAIVVFAFFSRIADTPSGPGPEVRVRQSMAVNAARAQRNRQAWPQLPLPWRWHVERSARLRGYKARACT